MAALRNSKEYAIKDGIRNNLSWIGKDGRDFLTDLGGRAFLQSGLEKENEAPTYQYWLSRNGITNSWDSWKTYRKGFKTTKKKKQVMSKPSKKKKSTSPFDVTLPKTKFPLFYYLV